MTGRTGGNGSTQAQPERVMLVGVMLDKDGTGSSATRLNGFQTALAEAVELVKAAGGDSVRVETAKRDRPHTALFVGTGKAAELSEAVAADGIDLVVFNHELTPTQERNLEKELKCRVLDRVGLILAIFARRARTQEAQAASRVGAIEPFGGTLDTRLRPSAEPARRYRHERPRRNQTGNRPPIDRPSDQCLEKTACQPQKTGAPCAASPANRAQSKRLRWSAIPMSANPACSTALTKSGIYAKDQLFATLDTTARRLYISPECSIILTDTVGFVSDLPHKLISAFSATLEETAQADVLLHVVDAAAPNSGQQIEDVENVLQEIHLKRYSVHQGVQQNRPAAV